MPTAIHFALLLTVVLIVITTYFLLGGLPLLILKHETPVDASFIRSFFTWYYRVAIVAAIAAAVAYASADRWFFAIGTGAIAVIALRLRGKLLPAMDQMGARIHTAGESVAVRHFRHLHVTALTINFLQLVVLIWGVTRIALPTAA
ncbi:MAG TPA: hypothetical protein PKD73_12795 [Burkholderiaceae bacterium]|jgi:hypothetical protein|nr:hypothetical protein [Burkholderiaceae bacterium]